MDGVVRFGLPCPGVWDEFIILGLVWESIPHRLKPVPWLVYETQG